MVELEFQRDVIKAAIGAAKRYAGTQYQKYLFVCGNLGIVEKQYRTSGRFTYAMYTRHLLNKVRASGNAMAVAVAIDGELSQHPTSNTGVNSAEQDTFSYFEEV